MPLTDTAIRKAKPADKPFKLADGGGMYLLVKPAGRYWRLDFRFAGKRKTMALGVYPTLTLKEARAKREEIKKQLAAGIDPMLARKEKKRQAMANADHSFERVAREWMENEAARWTPRYARYVLSRLEADIFPAFGHQSVSVIKPMTVLDALRAIERRGATDLPKRVRAVVSNVFKYAVITGKCESNPAADLQGALKAHVVTHQKAIDVQDLPELLQAIESYDSLAGGDLQTKLALKLLALTFVRTSEMRLATWEEFDLEKAEWRIPAERMKMRAPHIVPLSQQALEIIQQQHAINGAFQWVFAGRMPRRPMSENTALYALYRLGYRGRMTGHGFRAVASTILNEMGFRPDVIERQLAHKERNESRAAYHRSQYIEERKAMMQRWADHLDALRNSAEVVPIR
ncbi:MAG: tyrosine-type recombinase/integrase [Magnetococcales bacterium]|nr:tyrosine-type recombinase/integrase [Magnetococcales bacterium]